ncbi:hypothetical protein Clacol_003379 [Clathrus columnatus]|uniref:Uncharacterized protein n=1 Tax=Clathrus columnatus TaxID=1419009 RepID=A0AAV5A671_9AGAM|nr:hypothetical protein Clacol_003379 [Clathrus columnatus]
MCIKERPFSKLLFPSKFSSSSLSKHWLFYYSTQIPPLFKMQFSLLLSLITIVVTQVRAIPISYSELVATTATFTSTTSYPVVPTNVPNHGIHSSISLNPVAAVATQGIGPGNSNTQGITPAPTGVQGINPGGGRILPRVHDIHSSISLSPVAATATQGIGPGGSNTQGITPAPTGVQGINPGGGRILPRENDIHSSISLSPVAATATQGIGPGGSNTQGITPAPTGVQGINPGGGRVLPRVHDIHSSISLSPIAATATQGIGPGGSNTQGITPAPTGVQGINPGGGRVLPRMHNDVVHGIHSSISLSPIAATATQGIGPGNSNTQGITPAPTGVQAAVATQGIGPGGSNTQGITPAPTGVQGINPGGGRILPRENDIHSSISLSPVAATATQGIGPGGSNTQGITPAPTGVQGINPGGGRILPRVHDIHSSISLSPVAATATQGIGPGGSNTQGITPAPTGVQGINPGGGRILPRMHNDVVHGIHSSISLSPIAATATQGIGPGGSNTQGITPAPTGVQGINPGGGRVLPRGNDIYDNTRRS